MPEVAGKAACLVDPFNPAAIQAGILKVWHETDCRQELVLAGFANAKRFSARTCASHYAVLYAEMPASMDH